MSPFPADPSQSAPKSRPIWRPQLFPATIIVEHAADGFDTSSLLDPIVSPIEGEMAEDGFHAIVRDDQGDHRLWLPQGTQTINAAVVIPVDIHFPERVQSIQRFQRWLTGKPSGPLPRWQRFSRYQIYRLSLMLRAWDGVDAGASRQEIASILLNRDVKTLRSIDWKNAPERRRLNRLLKTSRELIERGYLRLLRP